MWFESDFKHDMDIKYVATERVRRVASSSQKGFMGDYFYLQQEVRGRQERRKKLLAHLNVVKQRDTCLKFYDLTTYKSR